MNSIQFFEVGGCVRDSILGLSTKDIDFTVVMDQDGRGANEMFDAMRVELKSQGFVIYVETPDKFTIRAKVPTGHPIRHRTKDADFVLARKEGPYSDGRRPDWVKPGTLADDLARRDFTVNAIAKDPVTGDLIDPHDGVKDISGGILRFVGDPIQRIMEDALRVVRGFRFMVTKDLDADQDTWASLNSHFAAEALERISLNRIDDEISRMFEFDTIKAIDLMSSLDFDVRAMIFREPLHLTGSQKRVNPT